MLDIGKYQGSVFSHYISSTYKEKGSFFELKFLRLDNAYSKVTLWPLLDKISFPANYQDRVYQGHNVKRDTLKLFFDYECTKPNVEASD